MEAIEVKKMGFECLAILSKMLSKQLTQDETYLKLMELHRKYPIPGHDPPLNKYQFSHFKSITVKDVSDRGVAYEDHLHPMNFGEAAEMYIRHRQKPIDHKMQAAGEEMEVPF